MLLCGRTVIPESAENCEIMRQVFGNPGEVDGMSEQDHKPGLSEADYMSSF